MQLHCSSQKCSKALYYTCNFKINRCIALQNTFVGSSFHFGGPLKISNFFGATSKVHSEHTFLTYSHFPGAYVGNLQSLQIFDGIVNTYSTFIW